MKRKLLTFVLAFIGYIGHTQIATGIIASVNCIENCYLVIQKGIDSQEMEEYVLQYESDNKTLKLNSEFKDLTQPSANPDYMELNPKYHGKKVRLFFTVANKEKILTKLEYDTVVIKQQPIINEKIKVDFTDSFPNATCKIYNNRNELEGFVDKSGSYYKVYSTGKKSDARKVQNKNEYCKGTKCIRITVNKGGYIIKYFLPNTTKGEICGLVDGNKLYFCKTTNDADKSKNYFTFTGDKQQAINLITIYSWFR